MAPRSKRANVLTLFFTLLVVMMGFGLVIPILPFYVESFGASGSALGLLMAVYALMQFLFAPLWGQLSDRYGRKPILLVGILGNALAQVLFGLSTQLWMLFAARTLAGILSSATLPTAMAYISDSTSDSERSSGMGIVGGAMGIGMVLGPGIAGMLGQKSLSLPFFLAAALSLIALGLVAVILPESLPVEKRVKTNQGFAGPQLREMWQALFGPIGILLVLALVVNFGTANYEGVLGLYASKRFDSGTSDVGLILVVIGIISAVLQMGFIGPLTRRFGDVWVIRVTLVINAIGFILLTFSQTFNGLLLTSCIFMLGNSLLRPVVSSITSKRTATTQGVAMGLSNAFMSLGRMIGPMWAGFAFDLQVDIPYISGAVVMVIALIISIVWLARDVPEAAQTEPGFQPSGD